MKKPKLSIIVPVYNVEQYLNRCLNSILNSTFQDFELIIINDGTKDNSENIIMDIQKQYSDKIVYVKKENTGLSDTRNLGMNLAKGEYISFIDSDDYIQKDMYELMMLKAQENNFDIVACDVRLVYEGKTTSKIVSPSKI